MEIIEYIKKKIKKPSKKAILGIIISGCQLVYPDLELCKIITKIILILIVLLVGNNIILTKSLNIKLDGGINECIGYLLYVNTIDKFRIFSFGFDKFIGLINTPVDIIDSVANLFISQNSEQNNKIITSAVDLKNKIEPNDKNLILNDENLILNNGNIPKNENIIVKLTNNINKSSLKTFFHQIIENL